MQPSGFVVLAVVGGLIAAAVGTDEACAGGMATMNAVRVEKWGGPEVLNVAEVPIPKPSPGEVLVKVEFCGVNPVDTYIRSGTYARKPALPYTPGSDGAGTVAAVGEGVASVKPGDRVFLTGAKSGTYAQYALVDQGQAHLLPDKIGLNQGAAIGVAFRTAYRALFTRGGLKPGMTVLVHGASGGVGTAAVQLAAAAGAKVFGTGSSVALEAIWKLGATSVYSHNSEGYLDEILAATDGQGVDLIVEMLANVNLGKDLKILARGGRVAVVGSRGEVDINPRDLMAREASVVGVMLGGTTPDEDVEMTAAIGTGLRLGTLTPVAAPKRYTLETISMAHTDVIERADPLCKLGKIVVKMWP